MAISQAAFDDLGAVIESVGAPEFWQVLHGFLVQLVPHDTGAAFVYVADNPPIRIFDSVGNAERDRVHVIQAKIGYLISPYYNRLIEPRAQAGFYSIGDVAPDGFQASEYYRVYYGPKGVCDEGMFLSHLDATTIVMMVERGANQAPFEKQQVRMLRSVASTINALLRTHQRLAEIVGTAVALPRATLPGFKHVAERFGADILSNRERDVAMLILRGHSSKSAARELGISPETERVHRRRLYTRLGISSQAELFWLFFQASERFDPIKNNDPLRDFIDETRRSPTGPRWSGQG